MSWWPWSKKRSVEKISKSELIGLLPQTPSDPLIFDRFYLLPTDSEVYDALSEDFSVFEDEANDCDDYAFRAKGWLSGKGWPFGVVGVDGHVLTCWINDKRQVVYWEPQTRMIVPQPEKILQIII